jgi:hypothetical protein
MKIAQKRIERMLRTKNTMKWTTCAQTVYTLIQGQACNGDGQRVGGGAEGSVEQYSTLPDDYNPLPFTIIKTRKIIVFLSPSFGTQEGEENGWFTTHCRVTNEYFIIRPTRQTDCLNSRISYSIDE